MPTKIGINGFGRIGRLVFRASLSNPDLIVTAINDPFIDPNYMAYMLRYDTVHGRFKGEISHTADSIIVNGREIKVYACMKPEEIPWSETGAEYIAEATGVFTDSASCAAHFKGGAKKVVITAPAKDKGTPMFVMGVNNDKYQKDMTVVSNASCTTNCLAPLAAVIHETFGIERGLMTTVHAYTNDQKILDQIHSDPRRARAAGMSMIPTTTGAARAVGEVLPELKGKLDGSAIRVPTPNVSLVDLTFTPKRDTTKDEVNQLLKAASEGALKGVLAYTDEPLVSIDFNHSAASSTVDSLLTKVSGRLVKVSSWYDNEWGFSNRMLDTTVALMTAK